MNQLYRLLAGLALLLAAAPAWSVYSCQINPALTEIKLTYNYFPAATATGTLRMDCTRDFPADNRRPTIWIGMDQTAAGRQATLDTGTATLNYEVFHGNTTTGTWTNTGAVGPTSTTNGAVSEQVDFGGGGNESLTRNYTFYVNVPWLQFDPAGIYLDTIPITIRLNDATGTIIGSGNLRVNISIPRACRFSTPPSAVAVNYTAFQTTAVTGTSNFEVTCTLGTTYTITLDQPRSVVPNVNLAYSLSLSAGTATGNAAAQPYQVNISVDAGQAGSCATSTCTGTDTRTLTVTY